MPAQRYQCMDKQCSRYARVTLEDAEGERARTCARHAVTALENVARARVVWDDTHGLNEHEAIALRITKERSHLSRTDAA